MNKKFLFALLVIAAAITTLLFLADRGTEKSALVEEDIFSRPIPPYKAYISGIGIVEAGSDNIFIGTPVNRLVDKVFVQVGSEVKKGDPLFSMENLDLFADLKLREVEFRIAMAKVKKLEELPRSEDVAVAQTLLEERQAALALAKTEYDMAQSVKDSRALSQEELNRRRASYEQAVARQMQAEVDMQKLKAGAWKPDLTIAELEALQAKVNMDRITTEIQRTTVRSPIDGVVLQIKIHEGEFPPIDTSRAPLMIVGNTREKHLQVSINQFNAPYFRPEAPAVAFLQGDGRIEFPLEFVQLEPYLVQKQNLNNEISEPVDTKVLQVIYRFKKNEHGIFVGQQMDVFIETDYMIEGGS